MVGQWGSYCGLPHKIWPFVIAQTGEMPTNGP